MTKKLLLTASCLIALSLSAHASLQLSFDASNPDSLAETLPNSAMRGGKSSITIAAGSGGKPDRVHLHSQLASDGESDFSYAIGWSANIQQHSFLSTQKPTKFSFNDVSISTTYTSQMYLGLFSANPNKVQPASAYGAAYGLYFFYSNVNKTLQIIERHDRTSTVLGSVVLDNRNFDSLSFVTDGITYSASYAQGGTPAITFAKGSLSTPFTADTWGSVSQLYLQSLRLDSREIAEGDLYVGSISVNAIPESSTYALAIGSALFALAALRLKRRKQVA